MKTCSSTKPFFPKTKTPSSSATSSSAALSLLAFPSGPAHPFSSEYLSQSRSITFQQLEIDYVIGESHKELLPNSSGSAAIHRIFGVTKEGIIKFAGFLELKENICGDGILGQALMIVLLLLERKYM